MKPIIPNWKDAVAAAYNAGRFEEALRLLRGVRGPEAEVFRGYCLSSLGRRREAARRFRAVLRKAGSTPAELEELAYAGPKAPWTVPEASAADRTQLPLRAAEVSLQRGDAEQARRHWEAALASASGHDRLSILLNLGRYAEAFQAAEALEGEYKLPWAVLGQARERLAGHVTALARLRREGAHGPWPGFLLYGLSPEHAEAVEDVAGFPEPRYAFMREALAQHRLNACRFEPALEAARGAGPSWRAGAYAAEALLCLGRPKEAFARMREACELAPERDRLDARAWLGELLLWAGRYAQARKELEAPTAAGSPYAFCWLGAALYKLGDPRGGLKVLDQGLERYPRDVEAYAWKGEILRKLGRHAEARRALSIEPLRADFGGKLSTPVSAPAGDYWTWHVLNLALLPGSSPRREAVRLGWRLQGVLGLDLLKTPESSLRAVFEKLLERALGCRRPEAYSWSVWLGEPVRPT